MCLFRYVGLKSSVCRRARWFYMTSRWGMNIGPLTLMSLFEKADGAGTPGKVISVGSRVKLLDLQEGLVRDFQVVTPQNSLPEEGRISFLSPLGTALMGAKLEDTASMSVFGRVLKFKVIKVE